MKVLILCFLGFTAIAASPFPYPYAIADPGRSCSPGSSVTVDCNVCICLNDGKTMKCSKDLCKPKGKRQVEDENQFEYIRAERSDEDSNQYEKREALPFASPQEDDSFLEERQNFKREAFADPDDEEAWLEEKQNFKRDAYAAADEDERFVREALPVAQDDDSWVVRRIEKRFAFPDPDDDGSEVSKRSPPKDDVLVLQNKKTGETYIPIEVKNSGQEEQII